MEEIMIKVDNVSKEYKLGQIGGTTLRDELQRFNAKLKGKDDPTKKIGTKDYNKGETFLALDDVSFEVRKGERIGIIGNNGAGKSTLLKLISRVTTPTSGQIGLNGRVASMLEVGTGFHPELTGRENIYMNGAILGMTKKEIDSKIEEIIEFSECRKFIDTPVKRYSSGMYVKLAFAVAAHLDSEIMIMDEVLAVGDMAFQSKSLYKMDNVSRNSGRTILYVSHNMSTIRKLCNRVIVLDCGKIAFDGDVEEAISVYLNVSKDTRIFFDFSKSKRTMNELGILKMKHLRILERNTNQVLIGDKLKFNIEIQIIQNVKNARLRLEIRSANGFIVGTAFLKDYFSAEASEIVKLTLELETKNFAPGAYTCVALIYKIDEFGNQTNMDRIEPALAFEIESNYGEFEWKHQYWGQTRFDDIVIKNIEVNKKKYMDAFI